MVSKNTFAIIGGDLRQYYLAESLRNDKNKVYIYGFEELSSHENFNDENINLDDIIKKSNNIILPIPITRDGKNINSPFAKNKITLNKKFISLLNHKNIFGGIIPQILEHLNDKNCDFYDYNTENFKILNAELTSEAAIKFAISNCDLSLFKRKILVTGYGRIGKIISKLLKNMGNDVYVCARNPQDLCWANLNGYNTFNIKDIAKNLDFNVIFNTVPSVIFTKEILKLLPKNTYIIDLASIPGGMDFESAKELKIKSYQALGLPGKIFPKNAGEIVKKVIYEIIEEKNLWKKVNALQ